MRRALVLGVVLAAGTTFAQGVRLEVDVQGVRSDEGQVRCSLFASAAGFPGAQAAAKATTANAPKGGAATCTFNDVAPGDYAVAVFHDENDNGTLDTAFLGIPEEGVGYSRTPPKRGPPPTFDAAKVKVAADSTKQTVTLQY